MLILQLSFNMFLNRTINKLHVIESFVQPIGIHVQYLGYRCYELTFKASIC